MDNNQNLRGLEWLIDEVEASLTQAYDALETYLNDPTDQPQLRFCLGHIHQVYGSLKIAECHGGVLLVEEMESLVDAMMKGSVNNVTEACDVLVQAILKVPTYLHSIISRRHDEPATLLTLLNDLRAVRSEPLVTETSLFAPDLTVLADKPNRARVNIANHQALLDLAKKLRQMYQYALLGILKGIDVDKNIGNLDKVFARMKELCRGSRREKLWQVSGAVVEGIASNTIDVGIAVRVLLRELDKELRGLAQSGLVALEAPYPERLLKNLLYYVCVAVAETPRIKIVRDEFKLHLALPEGALEYTKGGLMPSYDRGVVEAISSALVEEIGAAKDLIDRYISEGDGATALLEQVYPILKRIADTLAMVGQSRLRQSILDTEDKLRKFCAAPAHADDEALMPVASRLVDIESSLLAWSRDYRRGDATSTLAADVAQALDGAQHSLLREVRNSLEKVKEAIVGYISSQWDKSFLRDTPAAMAEIYGALSLVGQDRPAHVVKVCGDFIALVLLPGEKAPEWGRLDALADAITSIEFYLESLEAGETGKDPAILNVAEKALAELGGFQQPSVVAGLELVAGQDITTLSSGVDAVPFADAITLELESAAVGEVAATRPQVTAQDTPPEAQGDEAAATTSDVELSGEEVPAEVLSEGELSLETVGVAATDTSADEAQDDKGEEVDPEIREIFIEEAREVLAAIGVRYPQWAEGGVKAALVDIRRGFHTLKGSGRMVKAVDIGNLAWSVENVLNRVLDERLEATAEVLQVVERTLQVLPALVDTYERAIPWNDTETLVELIGSADALVEGRVYESVPEQDVAAGVQNQAATRPPSVADADSSDDRSSDAGMLDAGLLDAGNSDAGISGADISDSGTDIVEVRDVATEIGVYADSPEQDLAGDSISLSGEHSTEEVASEQSYAAQDDVGSMQVDAPYESELPIQITGESSSEEATALTNYVLLAASAEAARSVQTDESAQLESDSAEHPAKDEQVDEQADEQVDEQVDEQALGDDRPVASRDKTGTPLLEEPLAALNNDPDDKSLQASGSSETGAAQGVADTGGLPQEQLGADDTDVLAVEDKIAPSTNYEELAAEPLASSAPVVPSENSATGSREAEDSLNDIFANEAEGYLQAVADYLLNARDAAPIYSPPAAVLQQALHTLKGSASMADMTHIAALVTPLERFTKDLFNFKKPVDNEILQLLEDVERALRLAVENIRAGGNGGIVALDRLVARVEGLRERSFGGHQAVDQGTPVVDPEPLNRLMTEGLQKVVDADELLLGWQDSPLRRDELLAGMAEELIELGAAADKAGIAPLARVGRSLASAYANIVARELDPDSEILNALHQAHDILLDSMDRVAAEQDVRDASEMLHSRLRAIAQIVPARTVDETSIEPHATTAAPAEVIHASVADSEPADSEPADSEPAESEPADSEAAGVDAPTIDGEMSGNAGERVEDELLTAERAADAPTHQASNEPVSAASLLMAEFAEREAAREAMTRRANDNRKEAADDEERELADTDVLVEAATESNVAPVAAEETPAVEAPVDGHPDADEALVALSVQPAPSASASSDEFDVIIETDLDKEIIDIFLEEADELLEEIDQAIHTWQSNTGDRAQVDILKRALHTFKGGARVSGLAGVGDISHEFETRIIEAESKRAEKSPEFFQGLLQRHDRLLLAMDRVRGTYGDDALLAHARDLATGQEQAPAANESTVAKESSEAEKPTLPKSALPVGWPTADVLPFTGGVVASEESAVPLAPTNRVPGNKQKRPEPQEMIKLAAPILDELVNLAGETSIARGRVEQQVSEFGFSLDEMEGTLQRLQDQVRRLGVETEAQVVFRRDQIEASAHIADFDPLEMDRYSQLQQLSRALQESASDLQDLKGTLLDKSRDAEALLLQQSRINTDLQESLMRTRMVPFSRLVPRLRRIVRQVGNELDKPVQLRLDNVEGEMDRTVLEKIIAPLEHMIRNAIDHGIEAADDREKKGKTRDGNIELTFGREGGDIVLRLADDGRGLDIKAIREQALARQLLLPETQISDQELMQFIFQPGFSTSRKVTQVSGRGVGMDVVSSQVRQLGGTIGINSQPDIGTEFIIRLPFTVSVNRALMIRNVDDLFALPLNTINGVVKMDVQELAHYYQNPDARFKYAKTDYKVCYLGTLLNSQAKPPLDTLSEPVPLVLVHGDKQHYAVHVGSLEGSQEIVVKSLGIQFGDVMGLSGVTVLGDGRVVVILDLLTLLRTQEAVPVLTQRYGSEGLEAPIVEQSSPAPAVAGISPPVSKSTPALPELSGGEIDRIKTVMVVDDSVTVRKVTGRFLEREGFHVITAKDGVDAMRLLQDTVPDLMLLDIEMPRMDGFEVARLVRSSSRLKGLPIIMITSRTGEKHRERALATGVNKYLGKPYQEEVLLKEVKELLRAQQVVG